MATPKDPLRELQKLARVQELMPKAIASKIPKLYSQDNNPDPTAWVKYFAPYGRGTWLITEFDGRDRMFGLADLGFPELGYVSLGELRALRGPGGVQGIERDTGFRPMPLSQAAKKEGIRWSPPSPREASGRALKPGEAQVGDIVAWTPKFLKSIGHPPTGVPIDGKVINVLPRKGWLQVQWNDARDGDLTTVQPSTVHMVKRRQASPNWRDVPKDDTDETDEILSEILFDGEFAGKRLAELRGLAANWQTGMRDTKATTGPGAEKGEGSDVPDGEGNTTKRAFTRERTAPRLAAGTDLYVAVNGKKLLGATDSNSGANTGYWSKVPRAKKVGGFEIMKLSGVPDSLAEKLVDFGADNPKTSAWDSETEAYKAAAKYMSKNAAKKTGPGAVDPKAYYVSTDNGDTYGPYPNIGAADVASDAYNEAFEDSSESDVDRGDKVIASIHDINRFALTGDALKLKRLIQQEKSRSRRAAGGPYGFTKKLAQDCESAASRVRKAAASIAKAAYAKDARVVDFLQAHAERASNLSAKVLVQALGEMGPKLSSDKNARLQELREANGTAEKTASNAGENKEAKYGLYGYRSKTSKLGLAACSDLRHETGTIASDLHRRRHDKHATISEYMSAHCKEAGCNHTRLLLDSYPAANMKFAMEPPPKTVDDWLSWED